MKKNKQGFTLIELLVVIAIIGILSTMAVVALGSARSKARDAKRQSDLKIFQTAIEMYISDEGTAPSYPANWAALASDLDTYLPGGLPEDPQTGSSSVREWCYCVDSAEASKYLVATTLENIPSNGVAGDLDTSSGGATPTGIYDWATECLCHSDNGTAATDAVPTELDCQDDANGGIIATADNDAAATLCLGTTS